MGDLTEILTWPILIRTCAHMPSAAVDAEVDVVITQCPICGPREIRFEE